MFPSDRVTVHQKNVEDWLRTTPPILYDSIIAMDLIEHVRFPARVVLDVVKTRLKDGGTLILTTPDAASLHRKALGPLWPHYKVEHLTYPSRKALARLAEQTGLEISECVSLAKPLPIGYIIKVLKNFGPTPVRILGRVIDAICPTCIRGHHVSIPSGELVFIAIKRS
jgi:hypothetical protein